MVTTMAEQGKSKIIAIRAVGVVALLAVAACTSGRTSKAPVDVRGSDPATKTTPTVTTDPNKTTAGTGIISDGTDRYVVAENGDTVTTLAERHGLSASELAGYNGMTPNSTLVVGQDLVVPPGAVPTTGTRTADATTAAGGIDIRTDATGGAVEERPLSTTGGTPVGADGTIPTTDGGGAGETKTDGTGTGWSPALAAEAIARSDGGTGDTKSPTGLREDGSLGAPPSSTEPVPEAPKKARNLESPGLDQYQTKASTGDPAAAGAPDNKVAAADPTTRRDTGPKIKLTRPVQGPIAVGFGEGTGAAKNYGVDFSAPAGTPVVAAADGEVALISETLGGLGTIVLVRHRDELLTVYGRIDDVSVKKGDILRRGQQIGVVSNAGAPAEPRMHFEVRRGATVLDPMGFL